MSATELTLTVDGTSFAIQLEDNATTAALAELLPLELDMTELNGNEKYADLPESLPTDSTRVGSIEAGDVMLFGDDCLVVFYKSFDTSYSYTRIGHIDNADELAATLGSGNVSATLSR